MDIGKRLKRIRQEKGKSIREFAKETNFSPSFFSDIERGKAKPSLDTLEKLAAVLGTSPSELLAQKNLIGPRLEAAREKAGLSLQQLSQAIDIPIDTLSAWENEEKQIPLEALGKIREALGTSYSQLLDGLPSPPEKKQAREQIEWAAENSDDIPTGMVGLCLDWAGLVKELAPSWDVEGALEKIGVVVRKEIQGGMKALRKYELTPVPLLDPAIFAGCCGEGICYECLETWSTEMIPWALEPLGITYTEGMFCLKAEGDSMKQAGILNGALCLVVPYSDLGNGDVVLAVYGGNTKRWLIRYFFPKPDGSVILRAANPEYEDIVVTREERDLEWLTILGEVMALQSLPRRGL